MTLTLIKKNFHTLIDKVENKDLLDQFYRALLFSASRKKGQIWNSLTEEQKNKVLKTFKESQQTKNLVSHEKVMKKYSKWLTK